MSKSDTPEAPKTLLGVLRHLVNWYPAHLPGEERKLLFKLDLTLLIYLSLFYQTNINNAYVSGLKEDLQLNGNELNYLIICYNVPYFVFQIPGMMLLSRPKLTRWVIPSLEVLWGVLTFAQSRVTHVNQLYALRFLIGATEAPAFTGVHFVLGSWYGGSELFQRAGTWFICQPLGSMVSGYLQAAAHKNLNGAGGLSGWQWLFIVDGIITVPIALAGFFVFPGLPDSPKLRWYTEREMELARDPDKLTWGSFKRTFSTWHVYVFASCFTAMILSVYPTVFMTLWLKASGYSVTQINQLPTGVNGVQIISSLVGTALAAVYPAYTIVTATTVFALFGTIVMTIWNVPIAVKFAAWYSMGATATQSPLIFSVVNQYLKHDSEKRAIVMGAMMTVSYAFNTWAPLLIYPTVGPYGAPRWKKGWPTALTLFTLQWLLFVLAHVLNRRDEKKRALEAPEGTADNASEDTGAGIVKEVFPKSS
ncbi:putative pantothenate transporter [Plectosphaerella plurivora]|uniref:Pantothenate transporter n=1 Tax=Plectosphaerella plurivora TaxID=936078 RepID=A0A9P8V6Y1_9PEZI|nr:putative pantothenate transporter [Plectosphaerella plurivora]